MTWLANCLADAISHVAASPLLLVIVIIAATFVLEDLATATVALLANPLGIDWSIALSSLIVGTAAGDVGVYVLARHAASFPRLQARLEKLIARSARTWVESHGTAMILVARFTPGLRLPVFSGAGAIGFPFARFCVIIVATTLVWTPGLFLFASWSGQAGFDLLEAWGWIVPVSILLMLMCISQLVRFLANRRRTVPGLSA